VPFETVQKEVHEEKPIKRFSEQQHDDIGNLDQSETDQKRGVPCTDKLLGPSWFVFPLRTFEVQRCTVSKLIIPSA
jgi:hypothetical protein